MSGGNFHRLFVNALTFSRVPFIVAFMVAAIAAERAHSLVLVVLASAFMLVAGLSDLFDGILARRWQVVSSFGKLADPLMDKVFFIVTFPTLLWIIGLQHDNALHAIFMLVFTVLYILRDQWVTFLRAVASTYQANVAALWLGKVRTALSFPAAGLIYLYLAFHARLPAAADEVALHVIYAVELALSLLNVYSCAVYTKVYWPYMRRAMGMK